MRWNVQGRSELRALFHLLALVIGTWSRVDAAIVSVVKIGQ